MDNYKIYFKRFIKDNYPNDFDKIISGTDNHYNIISADTTFAKTSKNPVDRRLDFCSYFWGSYKNT